MISQNIINTKFDIQKLTTSSLLDGAVFVNDFFLCGAIFAESRYHKI